MKRFISHVSLLLAIFLFLFQLQVSGAFLRNMPLVLTQPDGTLLHLFASGDEYHYRVHDANDYTVVQDPVSGVHVYAVLSDNLLVPSPYRVDHSDPVALGLQKGVDITPQAWKLLRDNFWNNTPAKPSLTEQTQVQNLNTGTLNNLVVYIRFSDQGQFPNDQYTYSNMFNDATPTANSMHNYFQEVSYNTLAILTTFYPVSTSSVILSYQSPQARSYYMPYSVTNPNGYNNETERRDREHMLLADATNFIAGQIPAGMDIDFNDDGYVDNICYIIRGGPTEWSTLLWPHRWSLYSQSVYINGLQVWDYNFQLEDFLFSSGNGVLCHEMFHTLGAPDLYHYTSNGITPVGAWDLMANNTNPPQHMNAWMKYKYGGWIPGIPSLTAAGTYALNPQTSNSGNCWRVNTLNSSTEFFILEYRKQAGVFESSLPGSGMIIYKIDTEAGDGNASGPPDEVYVYRPNGDITNNGDINDAYFSLDVGRTQFNNTSNPPCFLGGGQPANISITDIGTAGTTLSFTYNGNGSIPPGDYQFIGQGYYDLQTNYSGMARVYLHGDGTLGATWMQGMDISSNFADRGSGYNFFNGTNWGGIPLSRIESMKTGWPSYSPCGSYGEALLSHTPGTSGMSLARRTVRGSGSWDFSIIPSPVQANNLLWPRMVCSGDNHQYLHVVGLTTPVGNGGSLYNGQDGTLLYSRSPDGGNTWDIQHAEFPLCDVTHYLGFKGDCYSFAEPVGNTLAFVYGNTWSDVFLMKSTDNGQTWSKTIIFQHPFPLFMENTHLVVNELYVCDGSLSVALDRNGNAHVFFGLMRVLNDDLTDGTTSYFPWTDGLVYWNESKPTFSTLDYSTLLNNGHLVAQAPDRNGNGTLDLIDFGTYFMSLTSMPTALIDDNNRMMVIMSTVYEDLHNGIQNYRQLQGLVSMDLGQSWSAPIALTGDDPDFSYTECVFPSLSPTSGEQMHLVFQADEEPGLATRGDLDPFTLNSIIHMTLDKSFYMPVDVGVANLLQPVSGPGLGSQETVTVEVYNQTNFPAWNVPVWYSVDGVLTGMDILPGPIPPNGSLPLSFAMPADLSIPGHTYQIQASTEMIADPVAGNNSISVLVTHQLGGNAIAVSLPGIEPCAGDVALPVLVQDFNDVASISLSLQFNPSVLTYLGYQNVHPSLLSGVLVVSPIANKVQIGWFSLTPASIGDGTLLELNFNGTSGSSYLTWETQVPGACMFTDINNITLAATFDDGEIGFIDCSDLEGTVTYDNAQSTPMTNVTVTAVMGGSTVWEALTNSQGQYLIANLPSGTCTVSGHCTKPWGGGNATDALRILQHFAGMAVLQGLKLAAADVDATGYVNAADALMVAKRFVNMVSSLPTGDWLFQQASLVVPLNATVTHHFKAICYGDVDGSNIPALFKQAGVVLQEQGTLAMLPGQSVLLPVRAMTSNEVSALSLVLDYPDNSLDIKGIVAIDPVFSNGTLVYTAEASSLRVAWYSLVPMQLQAGKELFALQLEARAEASSPICLTAAVESEAADAAGGIISQLALGVPSLVMTKQPTSCRPYPNPAADYCRLELYLPEPASVSIRLVDAVGQVTNLLDDTRLSGGPQDIIIDLEKHSSGVYVIICEAISKDTHHLLKEKLVIEK